MNIPDIVGLSLSEAKDILHKAGLVIDEVTIISPPRDKGIEYNENYRVIRVICKGNDRIHLQICKPL